MEQTQHILLFLSQDLLASTFSNKFYHDEEVSHTIHVAATLFDSNDSSFNQEAILKSHLFLCLLKVIFLILILMMKMK